jgi:hypothetical protein
MGHSTKKIHPTQCLRIPRRMLQISPAVTAYLFVRADKEKALTVRISPRVMASELRMTRYAVEEALQELESEGFISISSKSQAKSTDIANVSQTVSQISASASARLSARFPQLVTLTYIPWFTKGQPEVQPDFSQGVSQTSETTTGKDRSSSSKKVKNAQEPLYNIDNISISNISTSKNISISNNDKRSKYEDLGQAPTADNSYLPNCLQEEFLRAGLEEFGINVFLPPKSVPLILHDYAEEEFEAALHQLTAWSQSHNCSKTGVPYWYSYRRHRGPAGHLDLLKTQLKKNRERQGGKA